QDGFLIPHQKMIELKVNLGNIDRHPERIRRDFVDLNHRCTSPAILLNTSSIQRAMLSLLNEARISTWGFTPGVTSAETQCSHAVHSRCHSEGGIRAKNLSWVFLLWTIDCRF